jgi:hypothetical protein
MGLNLMNALLHERSKHNEEEELIRAFRKVLEEDDATDAKILATIRQSANEVDDLPELHARNLDPNRIFHENDIRAICVKYRLRFLDAALFKGDIPYEAITEVKRIQRNEGLTPNHFKIVAPAGLFKLKYKDKDPLLFLSLGNGYYYLVHKWGKDLHYLRGLLMYPFRTFTTLFKSIVFFSLALATLMPSSVVMGPHDTSSIPIRVIFFFYVLIALCGLTSLYGFSRMKNFSSVLWNSKYDD